MSGYAKIVVGAIFVVLGIFALGGTAIPVIGLVIGPTFGIPLIFIGLTLIGWGVI